MTACGLQAIVLCLGMMLLSDSNAAPPAAIADSKQTQPLPERFDPQRDAEEDFRTALQIAAATHRRVLIYIGGDWCESCRELDAFFASNPDLVERRDALFVLLKVNYSSANKNARLLDRLPFFFGYPHWFLVEADGRVVLSSFAISERPAFEHFLAKWSATRVPSMMGAAGIGSD